MSRGRDIDLEVASGRDPLGLERPEQGSREPERDRGREPPAPTRSRELIQGLSDADRERLIDVGRFRAVEGRDLGFSTKRVRALRRRGIVRTRVVQLGSGRKETVVSLTARARRRLQRDVPDGQQRLYSGFAQSRQLAHDAALYRLYRQEAARIEQDGGRVRRVILDHELKRRLFSDLGKTAAKTGPPTEEQRREAAERHHLEVVEGKIPLPDLRIEYQASDGRETRVDLELATDHYRPGQMAQKAQAGFKIYGLGAGSGQEGGRVRDEREITQEILSI